MIEKALPMIEIALLVRKVRAYTKNKAADFKEHNI